MSILYDRENVGSGYSRTSINNNFINIEEAFSDALSRTGNSPNQMEADLDLNSNDLLNVGLLQATNITVDGIDISEVVGVQGPIGPQGPPGVNGTGTIVSLVSGTGIDIDDSDVNNPEISLDAASQASLALADTAIQPADLATVATTGAYGDLSGTPSLGDAAFKNTGTTTGTVAAGDDSRITNLRERLTSNRTYYVRTDGSDSNNGLANTSGGAFLTIQKAIDVASTLDMSIYSVTIQVGNGTYTLSSALSLKSAVGSGTITIQGDNSTPSNVVVQGSGISLFVTEGSLTTPYTLTGIQSQITASGSVSSHIVATSGRVVVDNWIFTGASAPFAFMLARGGRINGRTFTVSAGANWMARADNGGASFLDLANFTATMSGTPAWGSGCVGVTNCAAAIVYGKTWSGSATGKRYDAALNGSIDAAGGGANFLPGNASGTIATGGQYA